MTKKSFRKIPKHILMKLDRIQGPTVDVVSVASFPRGDVLQGKAKKFGVSFEDGRLALVQEFLPPISSGRNSRMNKLGRVLIRKDLPMVNKTFEWDVPNWGDYYYGSHTISHERPVYQREKEAPRKWAIIPEEVETDEEGFSIGFRLGTPIKKADLNELLFGLNLLQENFGFSDVIETGDKISKDKGYKKLDWEVLPPGWWKDKVMLEKVKEKLGKRALQYIFERNEYIESLAPKERYMGQAYLGSRFYFVYVFDKCVVAECPQLGNAAYILKGDNMARWAEILSSTKRSALNSGAARILHIGNWKSRVKSEVSN